MDPLMAETVTLLQRRRKRDEGGDVVRDGRGNDVYETTEMTVEGCSAQPSGGDEDTAHREQVQLKMLLYAPEDFPGEASDAVIVDGVQYEITSPVQVWHDPILAYAKCRLTRTTG
jgi:hypothetical protein